MFAGVWRPFAGRLARLRSARLWSGCFTSAIEARFERETGAARSRRLRTAGWIALGMFDAFVLADMALVPGYLWRTLLVRFAVFTPLMLAAIWALRGNPSRVWRESVGSAMAVLTTLAAVYFSSPALPGLAVHQLYSLLLILLFANLTLQLRRPYALLTSAVILVLFGVGLAHVPDLRPGLRLNAVMVMLSAIVLTLVGNQSLEREVRRAWLRSAREQGRRRNLSESNRRLRTLSDQDGLTGLANRRALDRLLAEIGQQVSRTPAVVGLLMLDVDSFKGYNDLYGHLAGDACLRRIAFILREHIRGAADAVVRYGGEEFLLLLPGLDLAGTLRVAERVRAAVEAAAIPHKGSVTGDVVTISVGAAALVPEAAADFVRLVEAADAALYRAKQEGRNQVWPGQPALGPGAIMAAPQPGEPGRPRASRNALLPQKPV